MSCLFHQDAPVRIAENRVVSRRRRVGSVYGRVAPRCWCLCTCTWADASAPDAPACTEMKRLGARRGDAAESRINESGRSEDSPY